MHQLYFVVVPKEKARIGNEAISYAEDFLNENNFAGESGLYGGGKADWYAVGGRWSGELLGLLGWYSKVMEKINTMLKEKYPTLESGVRGVHYGDKEKEAVKKKAIVDIKNMWEKLAPIGFKDCPCPEIRDSLLSAGLRMGTDKNESGYEVSEQEDNAMICTSTMFRKLKEKYKPSKDSWGNIEIVSTTEFEEFTLQDIPDKFVVGNWLVVIDYHN